LNKLLSVIIVGLLCFSMFSILTPQVKAQETTIFSDNFESYAVGTFPSAGGWELQWNGAGNQYQVIVNSVSVSPTKSFQLLGSYGWSSVVKKDFTSTSNVIGYEVYVRTEAYKGSDHSVADVGFFNRPIYIWGRYYAMVRFEDTGFIRSAGQILQSYNPNTWYKVKVVLDKTNTVYNVWIDDVLKGQNLVETNNPQEILSFELDSEWAGVKAYFDDAKVFEGGAPLTLVPTLSPNLIPNSGFEGQLAYWSISEGTAIYGYDDYEFHSGLHSVLGVETNTGSLGRLYQDVTGRVSSGKQYKISGWIKTLNVEGFVVIALDYVASNGWTPADGYVKEIGYVSGTTDWTYYESDIFTLPPMPSDTVATWFLFDFNAGKGLVWWDDVSLNEIVYVQPDDLSVVNIEPVQVVYGASALVSNKPTLLRVDVRNSFKTDVITNIKISWDGFSDSEQLSIPPLRTSTFHLPSKKILKFETPGTHSVSATVDPDNLLDESDETNNYKSLSVKVKDAKELKLLYRGVNFPWESGQPDQPSLRSMNSKSSWFINGTYPISKLSNTTSNFPYVISGFSLIPGAGVMFTLWDLSLQAVLTGNDAVIGDVRKDFFRDHTWWTLQKPNTIGLTVPSITKAVLVEQGYWPETAHEIGHLYGLPLGVKEEYDQLPYPRNIGNWASGYWVMQRELLETYCFMGSAPSRESFDRWIENRDYEHLLTKFKSGSDPQVLFVGGIIFNNSTVELFPWYTMPSGTPDLTAESRGDYYLVFLNNQGSTLGQVGFNITFTILGTTYDAMGFAFAVPYFPDTHQILLNHESTTMAQRTVTSNPPRVVVTYPNGGEVMMQDRTYSLHWDATDPDGDLLSYSVLFSQDGGFNWQPLATNLQEQSFEWKIPEDIQTNSALIKVIASDGVNTGEDISDDIFVIVEQPKSKLEMTQLVRNELQYLTDEFDTIYADVKPDVRQGLLDKLTSATMKVNQAIQWIITGDQKKADNMLNAAKNTMKSFNNLVLAQSGKGIPEYKAKSLDFDSMAIIQDIESAMEMK